MAAEVGHKSAPYTLDSPQSANRSYYDPPRHKGGLFAPVEVLVAENERGPGATITYVLPSSLIVIEENPPLLEAAKALDEKLNALIAKATS
ncbi:MAG: hypothetical protein ACR652_09895 [Methylocystis sp.]|uniref:hypothetical protein n=1 Tax=Methylocystis sp. TaxID=1911079 RepID=UPI003DA3CC9C